MANEAFVGELGVTTGQVSTAEMTREALYNAVWTEPVSRLAPKHGLSDVGLSKLCRRLGIPLPPRGHWARRAHGKHIEQPPLPPPAEGQEVSVVFHAIAAETSVIDERREARAARRREIEASLASVPTKVHPVAADARRQLEARKKPDDLGIYSGRPVSRISSARLPRATRIGSTLLHALETLGCSLSIEDKPPRYWLAFRIERLKETCWLAIEEECDVVELKTDRWPRHKVVATGRLAVRLRRWGNRQTQTAWMDTEERPAEEVFPRIVASVLGMIDRLHARTLKNAEWSRKYHEEQAIRSEQERIRRQELERRTQLEADAEAWSRAEKIRTYIDAVERTGRPEHSPVWLAWARQHADRIDPTLRPSDQQGGDEPDDDDDCE